MANKKESAFQETCVTKMAGVSNTDEDATTTMDTAKYECNDTSSTASETELIFLEILITKMVKNNAAANINISNGTDSGAATQGNTYGILVTDKRNIWSGDTQGSNYFGGMQHSNYFGGMQYSRKYFGGMQYSNHR